MNIDQANAWKAAMAAEEKQRAERVAAFQEEEQRQRERACKIVNHHRHRDIAYSFRPLSYWEIPGSPLDQGRLNRPCDPHAQDGFRNSHKCCDSGDALVRVLNETSKID